MLINKAFLLSPILLLSSSAFAKSKEAKPNVLFILVDDLGKEWIEQYGAENIRLPNIEKLASKSILFENAYSMPQSTPSRMVLLTGQYPYHNGWVNHYDVPRWGHGAHFDFSQNLCFPKLVHDNGYKTCVAGKWQLNDFRLEPDAMNKAGFDDYCMWTGAEGGGNIQVSEQRYWNPYVHTKDGSKQLKGVFGPDVYSDFITSFIGKHKDEPMFIYYPMTLTHTPFVTTPHNLNAKNSYEKHRAMVEYTDYIIGKLLDCIRKNGLDDNTYIILATDNGTASGCVGKRNGYYIRGGKARLSQNGINAPFIVHKPGQTKGKVDNTTLIDFSDIFPTVLELTGTKNNCRNKIDGYSFVNVLNGGKGKREWALSMGSMPARIDSTDRVVNQEIFRDRVIIGKRYKIYITTKRSINRIFDMKNDPMELNNLVDDKKMDSVKKEAMKYIKTLPHTDNNPKYNKLPHDASWDYPLFKVVKNVPNYMPPVSEKEYIKFINGKK